MPQSVAVQGVELLAPVNESYADILTPEAMAFIVDLQRTFNSRRKALLEARHERQKRIEAGEKPDFLAETKQVRESAWTVAPLPGDILDRRVEITGPVDRKMIINALNSGAKVFMADFEDSNTPDVGNLIEGQINLRDAIRRTITYSDPARASNTSSTTRSPCCLCARAAGILRSVMFWSMASRCRARSSISGFISSTTPRNCWREAAGRISICRRWRAILRRGCGTTSFSARRRRSGVPKGTIKATVLIETILAVV